MRLVSFLHRGEQCVGVREGDGVIPVAELDATLPTTLKELLAQDALPKIKTLVAANNVKPAALALADIEFLPPIPRPGKVICIGRNYAAHAAEGGAAVSSYPEIFFRGATSLVAHNDAIIRPRCSEMLDFEGEIAFIVGNTCRHASEENALEFIAGYSLFNDATLRDYQRFSTQWTMGKNFDGTGAFGPELVTADELPAALAGCKLTTRLNGELMQTGDVDNLIFPIRKLVQLLSECLTLEPGDVVVTGTPAGVGFARKPPIWMQAGDLIEVSVAGLGTLRNRVANE